MLLAQYTPHTTLFYRAQRNVGWAAEMLQWAQLIHAKAVQQRRPGFQELTKHGPLAARCEAFSRCTDTIGSVASSEGSDVREFV